MNFPACPVVFRQRIAAEGRGGAVVVPEVHCVEIFTEHYTTQHALLHSSTIITTAHNTLRGSITRRQLQDTI
jgi:hypothetical protein